jgi:hypothetical protein
MTTCTGDSYCQEPGCLSGESESNEERCLKEIRDFRDAEQRAQAEAAEVKVRETERRDHDTSLPVHQDLPNPKDAFGMLKIPLRFVPWAAIAHLARVLRGGAAKYGWVNWRHHKVLRSVYIEAGMRHLMSLADGEDLDPESGERHEAHVMACMAILLDARENDMLIDDRPAPGAFGRLVQMWTEKKETAQ